MIRPFVAEQVRIRHVGCPRRQGLAQQPGEKRLDRLGDGLGGLQLEPVTHAIVSKKCPSDHGCVPASGAFVRLVGVVARDRAAPALRGSADPSFEDRG